MINGVLPAYQHPLLWFCAIECLNYLGIGRIIQYQIILLQHGQYPHFLQDIIGRR